uniref:Uncharacterized protein n=2 Tax=Anguilla anguilla TaxID=7936 RepID=A0A0E9PBR7_ANGAN
MKMNRPVNAVRTKIPAVSHTLRNQKTGL